jgi:hypothetical protein
MLKTQPTPSLCAIRDALRIKQTKVKTTVQHTAQALITHQLRTLRRSFSNQQRISSRMTEQRWRWREGPGERRQEQANGPMGYAAATVRSVQYTKPRRTFCGGTVRGRYRYRGLTRDTEPEGGRSTQSRRSQRPCHRVEQRRAQQSLRSSYVQQ